MVAARIKSLEAQAKAAGTAFGFSEEAFDRPRRAPSRSPRLAFFGLTFGGLALGLAQHFSGWGPLLSSLQFWRNAA